MIYGAGWDGAYRVHPDTGQIKTLMETGSDGEWSARRRIDALYMPEPAGGYRVKEFVIGVPPRVGRARS
jgi:hypothetical protein